MSLRSNTSNMLKAALRYAARSISVLPLYWIANGTCGCGTKDCSAPGKHPLLKNGVNGATTSRKAIGEWFSRWPKANIGIATGAASGLVALDVDDRHGGGEALAQLTRQNGELPETLIAITGNGRHFFFKHPGVPIKSSASKLGKGLDVRGDGGYVVAVPSLHVSGRYYRWYNKVPPAEIPGWLLGRLLDRGVDASRNDTALPRVVEGARNSILTSLAGAMRRAAFGRAAIERALLAENQDRCSPPLADQEVRRIAESISRYKPGAVPREAFADVQPDLLLLAQVQPEDVKWLAYPYVPLRKLTSLEGDPAVGKTWITLAISAALTRGVVPFTSGESERRDPASVLYLTAEDGPADTIRPRFDALGGNPEKMTLLRGIVARHGDTEQHHAVTLSDLDAIEKALKEVKPALVVIDPLQGYLGARVDMHRANEVRPVLAGLAGLAEKYQCAILSVRHLSKAQQEKAIYRGLGSIDFAAAARSILMAGAMPNDREKRAIIHIKSSLAPLGPSLGFSVADGKFEWTGPSDLTALDVLAPESSRKSSALSKAEEFLMTFLSGGPKPGSEVTAAAKNAGIALKTLYRAARELVKKRPTKFKGEWTWELDEAYRDGQETLDLANE